MDFTKAFYRVVHILLMEVLFNSGSGEPLLSWFQLHLHRDRDRDRKQIVDAYGIKSVIIDATSSVLQGRMSFLSFTFFCIINYQRY